MSENPTLEEWFTQRDPGLKNVHAQKLLNAIHDALGAQRVLARALHGGPEMYTVTEYRRSGLLLPVLGLTGQILPRTAYTNFYFYFDLTGWHISCRLGSAINYYRSALWNPMACLDWKTHGELEDAKPNEPFAANQQNFTLWLPGGQKVLSRFAEEMFRHLPH